MAKNEPRKKEGCIKDFPLIRSFKAFLAPLAACAGFALVTWLRFPHLLPYSQWLWLFGGLVVLSVVADLRGFPLPSTVVSIVLLLYCLAVPLGLLFEQWVMGVGNPFFTIGGLLPYSDASNYRFGAEHLIEYGVLDQWNSLRRPLPIGFYATIMRLCSRNLMLTIAVVTALVGISVYYLGRAVADLFGSTAALIAVTLVFLFYRPFVGAFLTEPIGLIFGCLALAFLIWGTAAQRGRLIMVGVVLFCFALTCRAGAFFLIPALLIFGGFVLARGRRFNAPFALRCLVAAFLALSSGCFVLAFVGHYGCGPQMVNLSHTLYGIAVGGKGWTQVYRDHPEVARLPEAQQAEVITRLVGRQVCRQPLLFLQTIGRRLLQNTLHPVRFLFPFPLPKAIPRVLLAVFLLAAVAALWLAVSRQRRTTQLLVTCWAGILFSSPLLVDGSYRVYAATSGVAGALAGAGCGVLLVLLRRQMTRFGLCAHVNDNPSQSSGLASAYATVLATALLLGPLGVKAAHPRGKISPSFTDSCTTVHAVYRASPASYIRLVSDSAAATVPDVRISAYRIANPSVFMGNAVFSQAKEGQFLVSALDLNNRLWVNILFDEDIRRYRRGLVWVCAEVMGGFDGHDLLHGRVIHWDP